ncbi:envelope stress response membrane protein PspB [Azospirillum sp.]|uniref:envelope stress response membrane protein PspB n=1 Tax=Azospirillum sp. TaxID=34012 RepID=UPI002D424305|nr:envelope stress response membrane protein PspB [Azospirillum sp.]HYD68564.1 envelope stress response membrane protein PspB [Azospirillum sp.]HYH20575.1 envelope stress response membrane protein PspB [Azospirillum sp.]
MDVFTFVLSILVVTIVLPLWIIFHFISRWRAQRGLSAQDERLLAELWDTSNRLEGRIHALERILDAEAPGWRNKT